MDHPVYTAALASRKDPGAVWIDTADTAKLIRSALATKFPDVKFYVRTARYAGGSSIHVYYDGVVKGADGWPIRVLVDYDGNVLDPTPVDDNSIDYSSGRYGYMALPGLPKKRDVDAVLWAYAGGRFDGMIDLAYSVSSWLNPDGSAALAHNPGTGGSMGSDPGSIGDPPSGAAILVHYGSNFVFVDDVLPYDIRSKAAA